MKNITSLVDDFINSQKNVYRNNIRGYTKSYLRLFARYIEQKHTIEELNIKVDLPDGKKKAAVISEEIGSMTGGRYYAWFIAIGLQEIGYDVTVYTNQIPTYYDFFKDYNKPKLEIVAKDNLDSLDVRADLYISSPLLGNVAVTKLAEKYKKPSYVMVFDPLPMMEEIHGKAYSGWDESEKRIRASNVNIITLCKSTTPYIYDWLQKRKDQVITIYPCINSVELKKAQKGEREDYVVFISRLVNHKKFEDTLVACKDNNIKLKVISSVSSNHASRLVRDLGMHENVDFYIGISDKAKFEMIYKSRAVINSTNFEGFGMWAAEAVATGTPVVAYDLPTAKEIQEISGADNFYLAKLRDQREFTQKLGQALKENKIGKENNIFDFENMINNLKEVFEFKPKIGIITIALNEEEYIGASLRSVIKHDNIKKVAVIEGAVNLFTFAANKYGLSKDKTKEEIIKVISEENGDKIIYERYGFASTKSELRNRALRLLGDMDYILVVDADEVWKKEDLDKLVTGMTKEFRAGIIRFNFNHFWKKPNLVATGSNWDIKLFRCFKFSDKSLHWREHELPVVDREGRSLHQTSKMIDIDDAFVYHYGYLKKMENVQNKIEYYKNRDTYLKVIDTWTNWKEGQPTSTTNGGGTVKEFTGEHPPEILELWQKNSQQ